MIDSHVHFWKYHPVKDAWINEDMKVIQADFLPDELHDIYLKNNIEGCIAVQADQSEQETEFLLSLAEQHNFIKGVVGWIDLRDENLPEKLATFSKYEKLKGWRHIAQAEPNGFLLSPSFLRGIAALKNYNYTYDILIGKNQLKEAIAMVEKFPAQRFVLDHFAKPDIKGNSGDLEWKESIKVMATHKNVYCKVSGMVTEADWQHWEHDDLKFYLDVVFESFGTDRLMFGSDWPVCTLAASYEETKQVLESYVCKLTNVQRKAIFELNAKECYQL
ncbi:amidohydrolase family protein [Pedobacter sp. SL55]|uniref:amidohydrolase family protein n=1 Tax=Pedobacter sp. SL55 TaxID=2995161 RepID=UPI002271C8AF|nr:amidohydrolase family protein [Pedobacter sp. SL55]WAC39777.1 amidohydrolase family protein [Pedobacter sp. SL55]